MDKWKYALIALAIGAAGGYMLRPAPEVKIKEVVKYKKQIQEKIIIKEAPDGTKTTTIDRSTKEAGESKVDIEQKNPQKEWILGAQRGFAEDSWGISAQRRIIGDVYLGGSVDLRGDATVNLSILF